MSGVGTRRARVVDWAVAIGLMGLGLLSVFIAHDVAPPDEIGSRLPVWAEFLLTAALTLPLGLRRRWPVTVLAVVGALFVVHRIVEVPEGTISAVTLFLALFSAGAFSSHPLRDRVRGGVVAASFVLLAYKLFDDQELIGFDSVVFGGFVVGLNLAFFVAAWLLGDAWRVRREHERELRRRADQLAAEREERARRAVLDERVRIARELHDVVAHHVSVMGVQAAGARRVLQRDPDRASAALTSVEQAGRQAVSELQRLVGFLRDDDRGDGVGPQPTLDDLDRLVATSGLRARLQWIGRARPVPSSVSLSAYRIVQESLTNALKHAGEVATTVVVTFATDALQVEVVNEPGTGAGDGADTGAGAGGGSGRGLLGMRERVAMLGGRFEHGVADGGRYRVFATLPTGDAYAPRPGAAADPDAVPVPDAPGGPGGSAVPATRARTTAAEAS